MDVFTNMLSLFRAGHKDAEPVYDVAEVQEGCDIPQHQINAGESHRRSCHTACYCALLLGALG